MKSTYQITMAQKPSIPKGTRDFSPQEVVQRNYIFDIIRTSFKTYGFQPIETPSFENSDTLMGKYGEEGDRLIFKILNSGDYLNPNKRAISDEEYSERNSKKLTKYISEKALRYDLTVPFARYVVQHQNEITFPFKRYQIQPVWRADRPQKGRFREFYQCDADVVGSNSLWQEVELVQLYDEVFDTLNLKGVTIKLNNRKILSGIAEVIGAEDKLIDFTVALDKLDKIGEEGVITEMISKGISEDAIHKLQPLFKVAGNASEKLTLLKSLLASSEIGLKGISELEFITNTIEELSLKSANLEIDVTLARGLNYYTGAIFEVTPPEGVKMGSIGGGGRYDDLTGIFGLKNMSGVGISFGLDRIYLVLEELNLFPKTVISNTKVLFINFGESESLYAMKAVSKLRNAGISSELYPDAAKMGKQMGYADKRNIPFVILAGDKEIENQSFTLKNMKSGDQKSVDFNELQEILQS
ncbi:MAG: histidyl-tRNA synthetase [Flavobacteriaceae bacterium]